jgi:hypothetical protein
MKIPMEIPEATVNATKEIVDFEAEAEMVRALFSQWITARVLFGPHFAAVESSRL